MSENPFMAKWTAQGHTLCLGHWEILYKNRPLNLPEKVKENHMDTFGIFSWLFPDDEDFAEGLVLEDWINEKANWLIELFDAHQIPFEESTIEYFYEAVNKSDWRCGSCGGCM